MWKTPRPSTWRGVIWGVHHPITTRYHKDIPGYARSQTEMVYDIGNSTLQEIMMLMQQRMGGSTYPAFLWKMVDLCYDMFSNTKWNFHQNFHQIWFKNGGHIFVSFTQTCVFAVNDQQGPEGWMPGRHRDVSQNGWETSAESTPIIENIWMHTICVHTYIHTYMHTWISFYITHFSISISLNWSFSGDFCECLPLSLGIWSTWKIMEWWVVRDLVLAMETPHWWKVWLFKMVIFHSYVMSVYLRVYFLCLTLFNQIWDDDVLFVGSFKLLRMVGKRSSFTYGLTYNNTYKKIEEWLVFVWYFIHIYIIIYLSYHNILFRIFRTTI